MPNEDRRAALEAAIDEHPDQPGAYLVLADWLQDHHPEDPRGELIVLSRSNDDIAGQTAATVDDVERATERARIERQHLENRTRCSTLHLQIGPAPPKFGGLTWFYGFVQRARASVHEDDEDWLRGFLDHPSLRHVVSLDLQYGGSEWEDRQWLVDVIAERVRPSCRHLTINCYHTGGNDPPCGDLDITTLWDALPRLEELDIAARYVTPGSLGSTNLHKLRVDGSVSSADLQPLLEMSAPALRELELCDVDGGFGTAVVTSPLAAALSALKLPYTDNHGQAVIRMRIPCVTFLPNHDGDRYEQVGE